jgi:hypothetical protein
MVKIPKLIHFFDGFHACLHQVLDSDPDQDPKPRVTDSYGSGSTTLGKKHHLLHLFSWNTGIWMTIEI